VRPWPLCPPAHSENVADERPDVAEDIRKMGYLLDAGSHYRLWFSIASHGIAFDHSFVGHRFHRHGPFDKSAEKLSAVFRAPPVESEGQLVCRPRTPSSNPRLRHPSGSGLLFRRNASSCAERRGAASSVCAHVAEVNVLEDALPFHSVPPDTRVLGLGATRMPSTLWESPIDSSSTS